MSDKAWALEQMFKYRFQVDFSRGIIECRGFAGDQWTWGFAEQKTFYEALEEAVREVSKY